MNHEVFVQECEKYKELLGNYCTLAAKCALTEAEADSMNLILLQAETDTFLSFLIDEADHFLAHELGLIDKTFIHQQQQKFAEHLKTKQDALIAIATQDTTLNSCSEVLSAGSGQGMHRRSHRSLNHTDLSETIDNFEQPIKSLLKTDCCISPSIPGSITGQSSSLMN